MTTHRILFFPSLLLLLFTSFVGAQDENQYNYAKFSPKMAIIIVVLVAALFSMGFISIYIRHCSDTSAASGTLRRTLSMRGRRAAAARGLDASVIETFPTFKYSEVKGHKIGKGALECAVCLNEFEDDETLRLIPKCDHVFHPECIDTWLEAHVTCPVCRADLVPQPGDAPDQVPKPAEAGDEIAIQIDENRQQPEVGDTNRTGQSSDFPNQPPRSWSVRTARVFGLSKFRSHSTGHSLVQPGENLDRFTLRLPECMRKEMMDRAVLNRTKSVAVMLPRERSSRVGRLYRGIDSAKSDRWAFFSRGLSVRSSKVVEAGESSGSSGAPVKLPSFNCLDPKTSDEIVLIPKDRS